MMTKNNVNPTPLRWLLAGLLVTMSCFGGVCSDQQIAFFLTSSGCPDCSPLLADRFVVANGIPEEDDPNYTPPASILAGSKLVMPGAGTSTSPTASEASSGTSPTSPASP